jgi:hypothetical protein
MNVLETNVTIVHEIIAFVYETSKIVLIVQIQTTLCAIVVFLIHELVVVGLDGMLLSLSLLDVIQIQMINIFGLMSHDNVSHLKIVS